MYEYILECSDIDYIIVFQNENHFDIDELIKKYNVIHVKSSYNTKYFWYSIV